jgi:glycosyltransferase involved in cell wall biosynthesis
MSYPTISVITPCYNGAMYLRQTIESVLAQTYPPLEMIVVDDGSTDDSAAIAESFGPPVRVIRQTNQGVSAARNRGIAEARGDYLHFLDADDLLHVHAYSRAVDAIRAHPGSVVVFGCARFVHDPGTHGQMILPEDNTWFPRIISTNLAIPSQILLAAELVHKCGGFYRVFYTEDWDLLCQVALHQPLLVTVPFIGCFYRVHAHSQTYRVRKHRESVGACSRVAAVNRRHAPASLPFGTLRSGCVLGRLGGAEPCPLFRRHLAAA